MLLLDVSHSLLLPKLNLIIFVIKLCDSFYNLRVDFKKERRREKKLGFIAADKLKV